MEDPSRIYRLLRLGLRLDFKPDERTERWLQAALEERAWESLDPGQQGSELQAVLREENCGRVLKMLKERGLLSGLDRKLGSAKIAYDRFNKVRAVVRSVPGADPYLLHFHCLVEKLPGADKNRLAKKILDDTKAIKFALGLEREAKKLANTLSSSKAGLPSQVYTLLSGVPQPLLLFLLAYYPKSKIHNSVKSFLLKFPVVRGGLPRAELRAMGMEPGPKFEKVMERVFLDQLDGKLKTHQQITKALRDYSGIHPPPPPKAAPIQAARRAGKGKVKLSPVTKAPVAVPAQAVKAKPLPSPKPPVKVAPRPAAKKGKPGRKRKRPATPKRRSRKRR